MRVVNVTFDIGLQVGVGQTDGHVITWFFWSIGFCTLFFHAWRPAARASRAREFRYNTERCIVAGKVWCLLTFLLLNGVPFLLKRWGVMADRNRSWAEYFFSVSFNKVYFGWRLSLSTPIGPLIDPTAMPCWWALKGRNSFPWLPLPGWYGCAHA